LCYLSARFGGGTFELGAQRPIGNGDTFLLEIGPHLVDDIVISWSFEVCRDDGFGIGLCLLAGRQGQSRGRPQPEQPIAARRDPEAQFLVALETRLRNLFRVP